MSKYIIENYNTATASASCAGCSFSGILTIAFIVLKLCGVINWSWLWVLCPIWIGIVFTVLILLIFLVVVFVKTRKY